MKLPSESRCAVRRWKMPNSTSPLLSLTATRSWRRTLLSGEITTEIAEAGPFYYAEEYHQQYLDKNPNGYCGLGGTGVSCPIGTGVSSAG